MKLTNLVNLLNQKTQTKKKKVRTIKNVNRLLQGRWKVPNGFEGKIFPKGNQTQGNKLKMLFPKKMLQRLPIAFVQVKAGNTFENLLKIFNIYTIYSLYWAKTLLKSIQQCNSIKV